MKFPKINVYTFYTVALGAIILYIVALFIITYSNYFSRTITIKDKSNYGMGKYMNNIVMDTGGNVYTVHSMYLVGNFDAVKDFAALEVGKTYTVSGYGISIPFLQMFPNINQVSPA
jgi:hypothetical protein